MAKESFARRKVVCVFLVQGLVHALFFALGGADVLDAAQHGTRCHAVPGVAFGVQGGEMFLIDKRHGFLPFERAGGG
ncbi:hypothetical protein LJC49_08270 [Ruminococcaceae bacterium OttesenSCG-928-I18]|nr:hypothetical protein [Ruminococcaceae bacterium OttesenSCG-928-I18]